MGDPEQPVAKQDRRMDFDELADAPLEALGMASSDAAALKQALNVETVRELAEHRLIRRAQAIVNLAVPSQGRTLGRRVADRGDPDPGGAAAGPDKHGVRRRWPPRPPASGGDHGRAVG
jgi:hypothetical protein